MIKKQNKGKFLMTLSLNATLILSTPMPQACETPEHNIPHHNYGSFSDTPEVIPLLPTAFSEMQEQPDSSSKYTFNTLAPTLIPALTGMGALIIIGVSIYDFCEEGFSFRRGAELASHLFWLTSAITGVTYNIRKL